MEGEDTRFECESHTQVIWHYNDGHIPKNAKYHKNILVIKRVTLENSGHYTCRGVTETNQIFFAESELEVMGK